jgi:integrase
LYFVNLLILYIPTVDEAAQGVKGTVCWATVVKKYVETVKKDLDISSGPLFRTGKDSFVETKKFTTVPIGKFTLGKIGKEIAKVLKKPDPEKFTGHCWRRSAATAAADNGATTMMMRTHFNWLNDSMCKYFTQ